MLRRCIFVHNLWCARGFILSCTLFGCIIYAYEGIESVCSIERAVVGLKDGTSRGDTLAYSIMLLQYH